MNDFTKTKKKKHNIIDNNAWDMFDKEIKHSDNFSNQTNSMECLYRSDGERSFCDCCKSLLIVTDEG